MGTQVTIEYMQNDDGSVEPLKIHTVVISSQHAEPLKATKCKEMEGYTGADATAPSMEEMNKLITKEVVEKTLEEIILKNGKAAISLYGAHTNMHINPSGKFIIGGPQGDAGLTGRKIIISSQHAEPKKATKCKEMEGYTGPDEVAPSMEEMNKLITKEVVEKTLSEIILKNGKPAITLYGAHTN